MKNIKFFLLVYLVSTVPVISGRILSRKVAFSLGVALVVGSCYTAHTTWKHNSHLEEAEAAQINFYNSYVSLEDLIKLPREAIVLRIKEYLEFYSKTYGYCPIREFSEEISNNLVNTKDYLLDLSKVVDESPEKKSYGQSLTFAICGLSFFTYTRYIKS